MPDTPRESHRSFTIRVPQSRYVELSDIATAEKKNLNQLVNELITLGLNRNIGLDEAIARFIKRTAIEENNRG